MAQTMRGGRELLNELDELTKEIGKSASAFDRRQAIFDPEGAYETLQHIADLNAQLREIVRMKLPEMLERAATNRETANVPDRVARLEGEVAELRRLIEGRALRLVGEPRTGTKD